MGVVAFIFAPLVVALGVRFSKAGTRRGCGRVDRRRLGNPNSALFPHAGAAQPVSPPACFIIAHRDFCGSVFVDRLGPHLGAGGGRNLGRADSRRSLPLAF